jgi:hypothetical protein
MILLSSRNGGRVIRVPAKQARRRRQQARSATAAGAVLPSGSSCKTGIRCEILVDHLGKRYQISPRSIPRSSPPFTYVRTCIFNMISRYALGGLHGAARLVLSRCHSVQVTHSPIRARRPSRHLSSPRRASLPIKLRCLQPHLETSCLRCYIF